MKVNGFLTTVLERTVKIKRNKKNKHNEFLRNKKCYQCMKKQARNSTKWRWKCARELPYVRIPCNNKDDDDDLMSTTCVNVYITISLFEKGEDFHYFAGAVL